jgi:DNA-binding transcriptional MerR regulator
MAMELSIGELARRAGVTRRTIRYYVEIGLLPPPSGAGRASAYGPEHLERLELIKKLQAYRLSLEEIRDHLAAEPNAESSVRAASLAAPVPAQPLEARLRQSTFASAADYIRQIRQQVEPFVPRETMSEHPRQRVHSTEQWLRIVLTPDVELHVRRRGTRTDRRLAKLVKEARRILDEEESS